jgi:hypothetical protein
LVHNSGRIDSFAWDPAAGRLFAAVGNGGVWRSDDKAKTWTSANGNLPTSITGAVAWSPANRGTLLALTGEPTFGCPHRRRHPRRTRHLSAAPRQPSTCCARLPARRRGGKPRADSRL